MADDVTGKDGKLAAYDPKSAQVVRLSPDELEASFLKGDTHLISDQSYPMLTQDGEVRNVPAKEVQGALRDFGMKFGNQMDVIRAEAQSPAAKYHAFADGVINRAAMGFGDAIQVQLGADPDAIQARKEENPGSRLFGEGVGALAGGAALGALAPGATLAETAPTMSAARMLPTVARNALGTAVEGTVHGVGDAVSEASLGRTDVTAESLLAHGGLGFALGGVLGGALRVPQLRAIRAADRDALMAGAGAEPEGLADAWARTVDAYHNGPAVREAQFDAQFHGAMRDASREALSGAEAELNAGRAARGKAEGDLYKSHAAEMRDLEGMHKGEIRDLERTHKAELRNAERNLRELERMQKSGGKRMAREAADLESARAERIGNADTVQAVVPGEDPNATLPPGVVRSRAAREAAAAAADKAGPPITAMEGRLGERQDFMQAAVDRARQQVADLRAGHEEAMSSLRAGHEAARDARRQLQLEDLRVQGEQHLDAEGPQVSNVRAAQAQYGEDAAKHGVARMRMAEEVAKDPRYARGPGFFERRAAMIGGRLVGGAMGIPFGGYMAEGAVLAAGGNPVRLAALKRAGNVVRDYIGERMRAMARNTALGTARMGLERSIAPTTLSVLNARNSAERRQALAARMNELTDFGDDAAVAQRATAGTQHIEADAPDAAALLRAKVVQAAGYLRTVAPRPLMVRNPLAPKPSYDLVPDRDARRFAEIDAAVQDPLRVVDELAAGRVPDPEVMRAVRTLYPETFRGIVTSFQTALAEHPDEISWETTIRAGLAFGVATTPALDPQNLAMQQQAAGIQPTNGGGGSGGPSPRQTPRSQSMAAPSTLGSVDASGRR